MSSSELADFRRYSLSSQKEILGEEFCRVVVRLWSIASSCVFVLWVVFLPGDAYFVFVCFGYWEQLFCCRCFVFVCRILIFLIELSVGVFFVVRLWLWFKTAFLN